MVAFTNPYVYVRTFEGEKFLSHLKIGDLVLTHKDRYKRVTKIIKKQLPKKNEKICDINFVFEDLEDNIVSDGLWRITQSSYVKSNRLEKHTVRRLRAGDTIWMYKNGRAKVTSVFYHNICKDVNFIPYLYSIEVEDDNSYYADNILVKN